MKGNLEAGVDVIRYPMLALIAGSTLFWLWLGDEVPAVSGALWAFGSALLSLVLLFALRKRLSLRPFLVNILGLPVIMLTLTAALTTGCTAGKSTSATISTSRQQPTEPVLSLADKDTQKAGKAVFEDLAGTSWQLVKITSMDDTVYTPDEKASYTLEFVKDGSMRVLADCNRGTGSWFSEQPGELSFSDIATTRALCPTGSLHDRYFAQFKWVRSYQMQNGNLFLATMADGSIVEFEPLIMAPVVATVIGQEIRTTDAEEIKETIITRLFEQYANQHGIVAEESEIDTWTKNLDNAMRKDKNLTATDTDSLTPEEAAELKAMRRDMARSIITQWKINRELHREFGGRIIFQQFGPEPLDAYRQFFKKKEIEGAFAIYDPALAAEFWRYFTDDSIHSFYQSGSKAEAEALSTPPWEQFDTAP